jgi:methyl-accepting chemotaxis protein
MGQSGKSNKEKEMLLIRKWNDLKIGLKIGIGFGLLIFLSAITGLIALSNMGKIQNETKYLANESLPSVNESVRADKDWREILVNVQAYDHLRDSYYLGRANQYLDKFSHSLDELIRIGKNSEESTLNIKKLSAIKVSVSTYKSLLSQYEMAVNSNEILLQKINEDISSLQKSASGTAVENNINAGAYHLISAVNQRKPNNLEVAKTYFDKARRNAGSIN